MNKSRWASIVLMSMALFFLINCRVFADPVWVEGVVTNKAWKDQYFHIEVNGIEYLVMPNARASVYYESRPGAYDDRTIPIQKIRTSQRVTMRVLGHNVYQITVLGQR